MKSAPPSGDHQSDTYDQDEVESLDSDLPGETGLANDDLEPETTRNGNGQEDQSRGVVSIPTRRYPQRDRRQRVPYQHNP